jgi:DNA-binding beta-propeller fold protein YncE
MVLHLLRRIPRCAGCVIQGGLLVWLLVLPSYASKTQNKNVQVPLPRDILLQGNRKLVFETAFRSEREVKGKPGFFTKVLNFVAGEPNYNVMVRPYGIAVDSRGREIVTDPGAGGVHIFDFARHKYRFISRLDKEKDPMLAPQCVALDADDNIYVTDSLSGKIFVFEPNGKLRRVIGSLRGGEGYFKRPTGIAIDSAKHRIYVTDTLRNKVFELDMKGEVLKSIGTQGSKRDEFNFPTELLLRNHTLYVVDAMNFRVEKVGQDGEFRGSIGAAGDSVGSFFRPKGIAQDSEGNLYVVDASQNDVQVYNAQGDLLYYFGGRGNQLGAFQLPSGIFIDHSDRVYVVDSYNRRVQVFRYVHEAKADNGGRP